MTRWIVFDEQSRAATQHDGREVELHPDASVAHALNDAVENGRPVIVVLPAGDDQATVARVTPPDTSSR